MIKANNIILYYRWTRCITYNITICIIMILTFIQIVSMIT